MKISLPAPPKGWKALAFEFATIVFGVLAALGAQEYVQGLHWRREVRETRSALDAELSRDMAVFNYRMNQRSCIEQRTDELARWAASLRSRSPLQLKHEIQPPPGFAVRRAVWEVTDGEIASRIPLDARLNYAGLYEGMGNYTELANGEGEDWDTLLEYGNSSSLTEPELRSVQKAIGNIKAANLVLEAFATTINRHARALGIEADPKLLSTANPLIPKLNHEACRPYL